MKKKHLNNIIKNLIIVIIFSLFIFFCIVSTISILNSLPNKEQINSEQSEIIYDKKADQSALDAEKLKKEQQKKKQEEAEKAVRMSEAKPIDIKEQKWQEARQQVPPLTKSQGVHNLGAMKLTYYSSKVLYHYRTAQWRLDDAGLYRDWNGSEWCYVVSMNTSYGYGTNGMTVNIGIPVMVWDSGCAVGTIDMYCNW